MNLARTMWEATERYHQPCYVVPEVREAGTKAGLKGFWMNYFATRAAPMGAVGPETVEAVFFYYAPSRVRRAIPDAWRFSDPQQILAARYEAMDDALRRLLGPVVDDPGLSEAVALHQEALQYADVLGRPLYAAWAGLEWPTIPHLALWHAATLQREYRSGCHLLALGAAGLNGCQSVVSQVAVDEAPRVWITEEASWTTDEAAQATAQLIERGWLDANGAATAQGRAGRAEIEAVTDRLDGHRWNQLGDDRCQRLLDLMERFTAPLPPDDQLDWREIYGDNHPPEAMSTQTP